MSFADAAIEHVDGAPQDVRREQFRDVARDPVERRALADTECGAAARFGRRRRRPCRAAWSAARHRPSPARRSSRRAGDRTVRRRHGRRPSADAACNGEPTLPAAASSAWSIASRIRVCLCSSSRIVNPGGTPASSGKRCSSRSQKAWIVCTLRPPGVSMASAKSARARAISAGVGSRPSRSANAVCSFGLRRAGPRRETVEHARRHFRRRGLGEGQAQDALGLGAGEEQAEHARGQHVGLAGAGVGGDPGRRGRDRRRDVARAWSRR